MKVLFVPCPEALQPHLALPHLIPLVALASRLTSPEHEAMFLAPRWFHASLKSLGHQVHDSDYDVYHSFRQEMIAYGQLRPDVIVDDMSTTALLSTSLAGIPRVALRRTGVFPGMLPRNSAHRHSLMYPSLMDRWNNCEEIFGVPRPKNFSDVFSSAISIVPGIQTVEVLPPELASQSHYRFAGPLILPDEAACKLVGGSYQAVSDRVSQFLDSNAQRPIVFVTAGTILKTWNLLEEVVRHVLHSGAAVISTIDGPEFASASRDRYLFSPFLPLHQICSRAHFMVHHCGSGTYQYQLLHALPAICIGSGCYDRDDVAARLDELGVAKYIPSPEENPDFLSQFRRRYDECADLSGAWYASAKRNLAPLKQESEQTSAAFDFEAALHAALSVGQATTVGAG